MAALYGTVPGPPDYARGGAGGASLGLPAGQATGNVFVPGKRRRLNLVAICANIFLPWFAFSAIYAGMSFSLHYQHPSLAIGLAVLGLVAAAVAGAFAARARQRGQGEMWYTFFALALLIATVAAFAFGELNFSLNMQRFYDIENLNTYPSVNPARERGQQLMDAGRVYFADGTGLDMRKAMAFRNLDLYCVAPIVHGEEQLASYDFWAVGVNCCSGVSSDFRCGEFNNPHARSGLRLMADDQRPFFRLAVQQAEAAYNIKSTHPLFFIWMQDPVAEMNAYRDSGFRYYLLGVFTHFAFNLCCTAAAVMAFSKIGNY
uniref:Uncharacterized protein n=1 Tax=Zooxanthella nutricula TaxID=1333877 RepID=A0A7S2JVN1_9DINO|mmetsp:Transcript_37055/g.111991  ORF Transcript_37055/g.111991 Transcript_37055/m.111991 type:complete len:317 (+) Transcript_37055:72-1022(+)